MLVAGGGLIAFMSRRALGGRWQEFVLDAYQEAA